MEEFKPGYYIKYDGFRETNQFTVLCPEGRVKDVSTREEALKLLKESGGYYGSKTDISIHFPFSEKYIISEIVKGNHSGKYCCQSVKFSDDKILAELENDGGFILIDSSYLKVV